MDKSVEKSNLPKLNEEAESLNKPVTADKIEAIIKNSRYTKTLDWLGSQKNSMKHLRKS